MTFLQAQKRWPTAHIIGDGRYACVAQNGSVIYLVTTQQQSFSIGLGVDGPKFFDLQPKFVPNIPRTTATATKSASEKSARLSS
jgi:hypothetical protein